MQFDSAVESNSTTFEYAYDLYNKKGLKLPQIVCWNLRTSHKSFLPTTIDSKDYVMLSGYSSELFETFLNTESFDSLSMMNDILSKYKLNIALNLNNTKLINDIGNLETVVEQSKIRKSFKK